MENSLAIPALVLILGWLLAAAIGSWAYFAGKPNKNDKSFPLPRFVTKP
jgi:TRAP-type C4-dicarboxylate transport system permease small subunit